jgi:hypothetical protein
VWVCERYIYIYIYIYIEREREREREIVRACTYVYAYPTINFQMAELVFTKLYVHYYTKLHLSNIIYKSHE